MGKWVKRAARRHLRDLVHGPKRQLRFDVSSADRALRFISKLRNSKGEWAGKPLVLAPWQVFVVGNLFGWKRLGARGWFRRFRTAYIETGKKSGKSTFIAAISIYATFFDEPNEHGAEGFTAATKRQQAKITWDEAREMVRITPGLKAYIRTWGGTGPKATGSLTCDDRRQSLQPLGKDYEGLDGVNPHFGCIDELHALKDRKVWDTLTASRRTRRQALIVAITNTGQDEASICYEQHLAAVKVLSDVVENDAFFAFVCAIDKGDDWKDETKWCKANPGLGLTFTVEDLRDELKDALASPGAVNRFRRFGCGEWVVDHELAIDMDRWKACGGVFPLDVLRGRPCFGGLDLAVTTAFAAWDLYFPPTEDDPFGRVLVWLWRPRETFHEAIARDNAPFYRDWLRDGYLELTEGSVIDFRVIRKKIQELSTLYDIRSAGFDPWQAEETRQELEDFGIPMVKVPQRHSHLSAPTRRLEELYMAGRLRHSGNPALAWMAANVVWRRDGNNNYIPNKGYAGKHRRHIDAISALVTAMACEHLAEPPPLAPQVMIVDLPR